MLSRDCRFRRTAIIIDGIAAHEYSTSKVPAYYSRMAFLKEDTIPFPMEVILWSKKSTPLHSWSSFLEGIADLVDENLGSSSPVSTDMLQLGLLFVNYV